MFTRLYIEKVPTYTKRVNKIKSNKIEKPNQTLVKSCRLNKRLK